MLSAFIIFAAVLCRTPCHSKAVNGWPTINKSDLANTVLVIHEVEGTATLIRKGVTYQITSFDAKVRQAKKLLPHRLVVLDQDQFWLGPKSIARVSYPQQEDEKKSRLTVFGKDEREEGRTYRKNWAVLSTSAIRSLRILVRLGQNSKPLPDASEPQIILPQKDEIIPSGGFNSLLLPLTDKHWVKVSIVYPLSSGALLVGSGRPDGNGRVVVSRKSALDKLAAHFGSSEDWKDSEIGLRLVAQDRFGKSYYQNFYLASPKRERQMFVLLNELQKCLSEDNTFDREIRLADLCGLLSDSPSVLIEALSKYRQDPSVDSALVAICEVFEIPVRLFEGDVQKFASIFGTRSGTFGSR